MAFPAVGVVLGLTVFILVARPLILAFGLPEMLMVTILGLSMVAILAALFLIGKQRIVVRRAIWPDRTMQSPAPIRNRAAR